MSGMPNAELAQEQQRPGEPIASPVGPNAPEPAMLGSELPEAPKDKFFRKMREQPLVPIGTLAHLPSFPFLLSLTLFALHYFVLFMQPCCGASLLQAHS